MSSEGVAVSVDLSPGASTDRAPASSAIAPSDTPVLIDVERRAGYDVADFWEPIRARKDKSLILDPDEFYILASKESVQVPPDYAAEMVPFDPLVGEFRVHYAGFFDPGFGYAGAGGRGSRAVLEVRSREVPFILEHGQIVGPAGLREDAGPARNRSTARASARTTRRRGSSCPSISGRNSAFAIGARIRHAPVGAGCSRNADRRRESLHQDRRLMRCLKTADGLKTTPGRAEWAQTSRSWDCGPCAEISGER